MSCKLISLFHYILSPALKKYIIHRDCWNIVTHSASMQKYILLLGRSGHVQRLLWQTAPSEDDRQTKTRQFHFPQHFVHFRSSFALSLFRFPTRPHICCSIFCLFFFRFAFDAVWCFFLLILSLPFVVWLFFSNVWSIVWRQAHPKLLWYLGTFGVSE